MCELVREKKNGQIQWKREKASYWMRIIEWEKTTIDPHCMHIKKGQYWFIYFYVHTLHTE